MNNSSRNQLISFLIISSLMGTSTSLYSAAFMLSEQNTSGLGHSYAGKAAIAEDASTSFYNPAGLVKMNHHQAVASVVNPLISIDTKAREVTTASAAVPAGRPVTQGKRSVDIGEYIPIPAFHIAGRLDDKFNYGFSVTAPFGLATKYNKDALTRYFGTKSEVQVIDLNPNLAYKINPCWSVGGGVSAQYVKAKLNSQIDTRVLLGAPENIDLDAQAHNTADGWGVGYNFGFLFQPSANTRFGLAFRSKVKHNVDGTIKISAPPGGLPGPLLAAGLVDQKVKSTVTLPESLSVSGFQTINSDWDVMGDITYTNWHRFKKLVLKYPNTALADVRVEEKFKDTIRVAVGANYKYNRNLTFKFGTAYDQSPVEDKHRNFRVPDSDRYWLSAGAKYVLNNNITFDLGYAHIFVDSAKVREARTAAPNAIGVSKVNSSIDLIGIQASYTLV